MSSEPDMDCAANSKSDAESYVSNSKAISVTPFALALQTLFPSGGPRARIVAFFQNRAPYETVKAWRLGYRNPPAWAVEIVRQHCARIDALAAQSRVSKLGDPKRFKRRA